MEEIHDKGERKYGLLIRGKYYDRWIEHGSRTRTGEIRPSIGDRSMVEKDYGT
jgi:hypothetical protein